MSNVDIAGDVRRHDQEIADLKKEQDLIFGKLDQLTALVGVVNTNFTEFKAQKGPGIRELLDIATRVGMLFAMIVGGIIRLAVYASRPDTTAHDKRISKLEWLHELRQQELSASRFANRPLTN